MILSGKNNGRVFDNGEREQSRRNKRDDTRGKSARLEIEAHPLALMSLGK